MAEIKQEHASSSMTKSNPETQPKNTLLELLQKLALIKDITHYDQQNVFISLKREFALLVRGGKISLNEFEDDNIQRCFLRFENESVRYEIFEMLFTNNMIPLEYKICGTPLFHLAMDWYKPEQRDGTLLMLMTRYNRLPAAKEKKFSFLALLDAHGNNGVHHLVYRFFDLSASQIALPLDEILSTIPKDQLDPLLNKKNNAQETPLELMGKIFITQKKTIRETLPLMLVLMRYAQLDIRNIWRILASNESQDQFAQEFLTAVFDAAFFEGNMDGPANKIIKKLLVSEDFTLPVAAIYPLNIHAHDQNCITDALLCAVERRSSLALPIYTHLKARGLKIDYQALIDKLISQPNPNRALLTEMYVDAYNNIYLAQSNANDFKGRPCKHYALAVLDKLKNDEANCRKVLQEVGNEFSDHDYETLQRHGFPVEKFGCQVRPGKTTFGPVSVDNRFNWLTSRNALHKAVGRHDKQRVKELLTTTKYFSIPRLYTELAFAFLSALLALSLTAYMISVFATGGASLAAIGVYTMGLTTATKTLCALTLTLGVLGSALGITTVVAEAKTINLVKRAKEDVLQVRDYTDLYSPHNPLLGS